MTDIINKKNQLNSREKEQELLMQFAAGGESGDIAFEKLIELHKGYIKRIACKYVNRGIPVEELEQAGFCGLFRAVRSYDASRGYHLLTYADKLIRGEMINLFRQKYGLEKTYSLDEILFNGSNLYDTFPADNGDEAAAIQVREIVDTLLCTLGATEGKIVRLFFGFDSTALSIPGIARHLDMEKEQVRQILFTSLRAFLKPGKSQAINHFIHGNVTKSIMILQDHYALLIEKIALQIWESSAGSLTQFHKELVYFTHFFDPVSDLAEEFHTGWNQRAEFYTECISNTLNVEKKAVDCTLLISWLYHTSLYIIMDVFLKIAEKCQEAKTKKCLSLLVHMYWQDIVFTRIYNPLKIINKKPEMQRAFLQFYFNYCGSIFRPAGILMPDQGNTLHFNYTKLLLLFNSSIQQEKREKSAYKNYCMTHFFGPVIRGLKNELNKIMDNIFKTSLTVKERKEIVNLAYYFQRVFPYLTITREMTETEAAKAVKIKSCYASCLEGTQTMFRLGYQAGLRKLLLNALERYREQLNDVECYNRMTSSNPHFFKRIKHRIHTETIKEPGSEDNNEQYAKQRSFFLHYEENIGQLLVFLKKNGGLNLLQLPGFKMLEGAGIDYPPGYITGER